MHDPICKKFIRTENLCNLLNIISLLLSFALFISGIKTCLEKRKPINKNINTGISKAIEKANIMPKTKSKYRLMSVMISMPSGAAAVKKLNTNGNTKKYVNKTPK